MTRRDTSVIVTLAVVMKLTPLLLVAALALAGCMRNPTPKERPKEYIMHGEVKALNEKDQLATVNHENIDGWMEAMTMEYPVRNPPDFSKLKVGEKIEAKIVVDGLQYWISEIKEAPAAPGDASKQ